MANLPLSSRRLASESVTNMGLADNLDAFLARASALAAMIVETDPRSDAFLIENGEREHPIQRTAYALWLELQDARTVLEAWHKAQRQTKGDHVP